MISQTFMHMLENTDEMHNDLMNGLVVKNDYTL